MQLGSKLAQLARPVSSSLAPLAIHLPRQMGLAPARHLSATSAQPDAQPTLLDKFKHATKTACRAVRPPRMGVCRIGGLDDDSLAALTATLDKTPQGRQLLEEVARGTITIEVTQDPVLRDWDYFRSEGSHIEFHDDALVQAAAWDPIQIAPGTTVATTLADRVAMAMLKAVLVTRGVEGSKQARIQNEVMALSLIGVEADPEAVRKSLEQSGGDPSQPSFHDLPEFTAEKRENPYRLGTTF